MKSHALKCLFLFFTFFNLGTLRAQQFETVLQKLHSNYRQEKIHMHFDRSAYHAGEVVWYKAYLYAGNYPSQVSKTIYAELVDASGKVLERVTSPVIMSGAFGSFRIPIGTKGPVYVKAYTKWMLNFDPSFLYTVPLSIIPGQGGITKNDPGVSTNSQQHISASSSNYKLEFFPEGGDLVQGVKSRVAFKATTAGGLPVNISGEIFDNKGQKLSSFETEHDGMGRINLWPNEDGPYKALWKDENGNGHETILPLPRQDGLVLEVEAAAGKLQFTISRPPSSAYNKSFQVVGQMQQQMLFKARVDLSTKNSSSALISTDNFPAGILQLTVFDLNDKPLAERIVFVNLGKQKLEPAMTASIDTGPHKKNRLEISIPDTSWTNLSVSVTDADRDPSFPNNGIYSSLLLETDIRGYVHHPAYYFESDHPSVNRHLDLVMMTHGWRRFKWEEVLAGRFPELKYMPEDYITIEGTIKGISKRDLANKDLNAMLEEASGQVQYLSIPVMPSGDFIQSGLLFYDTAKLFYQFNKDKNNALTNAAKFEFRDNNFLSSAGIQFHPYSYPFQARLDSLTSTLIKQSFEQEKNYADTMGKVLENIRVTAKTKTEKELLDEKYSSGAFETDPSRQVRVIFPDDDPSFLSSMNLLVYLQDRIPGLQYDPNLTLDAITWRGSPTALFVDEIAQTASVLNPEPRVMEDASYILSLPMSEIAMVKVFPPPFIAANHGGAGGAIAVYLYKAGDRNLKKGMKFTRLAGYTVPREFYSPDHSKKENSKDQDLRRTLYWNPMVVLDKNNQKVMLEFYNNDITRKMKIVIEGCNEEGRLVRQVKIVE